MKAVWKAVKALDDVPEHDKMMARLDFKRAKSANRKRLFYRWTAPLVVPVALLFTPRSADKLHPWFHHWDNEVNLNGDGWGWRVSDDLPLVDTREAHPSVFDVAIRHSHPDYDGIPYYVPKWLRWLPLKWIQPRGYVARYVWIGLRNRASQKAVDLGQPVLLPVEILSGSLAIGRFDNAGHVLLRSGDLYQYQSYEMWEPLGKLKRWRWGTKVSRKATFAIRRNYGHKLDIAYKFPHRSHAAAVAIGWSLKRWRFTA